MHSTRYNHIIFQKTKVLNDKHTILRGVYSSEKKARTDLDRIRKEEYDQLANFFNTIPNETGSGNRTVLTVPGTTVTLILMKLPQDVTTAMEI